MQYTCAVPMCPIDQLVELAKTVEEVGFDNIALPDSIFYMEKQSADYPYTADGSRMWDEHTPWVDPLIAAGAMGAVTSTLRFYTHVMKLGSRGRQPDQQPVRIRCRDRLGARRIRMVRPAVQQAR
jgi:alkanesulfonate monooxygenase SsuD/methylene tetrahydromethanopterin reductase-like flavin-dependent oxidoreductase (luciferase family)